MQVKELMTTKPRFVPDSATLKDAARTMRELDVGFLPVADEQERKLKGVITDRDITVRGVAEGRDPESTTVTDIRSNRVLYCFQDDEIEEAAKSMQEQQVYRLVVLESRDDKKLCGIITLGDILRHQQPTLAAKTAEKIVA
jgi:CBS domain-containing protein